MSQTNDPPENRPEKPPQPAKILSEPAKRALAEAAERRAKVEAEAKTLPKEEGGPAGLEPTRYGDWERKGLASDF